MKKQVFVRFSYIYSKVKMINRGHIITRCTIKLTLRDQDYYYNNSNN